eukprot:m.3949 g.3949  ORF g.3949 m.3949 type:complete len:127 (-) comp2150_c0_seq1:1028-1408(-)
MASRRFMSLVRTSVRRAEAVAKTGESELAGLRQKETLPWTQLSTAEKSELYRASYGNTRKELLAKAESSDTPQVLLGTGIGLAVAFLLFKGIQSLADPSPKTLSDEWVAAEKANATNVNANPSFGN